MIEVTVPIRLPPKVQFLFKPMRYKVLYGGRGSAKSHSVAKTLLMLGVEYRLRVLCTREVQKTIAQSVHKLLKDQIQELQIGHEYEVLDNVIRGRNGTEFLFTGLADHTAESIKSYEAIDIVWVEEARSVSKNSWDVLIPTIRKDGSEIWITFNPELDTDETYVRFVLNPPPNTHVEFMNYTDNPWFPKVLEDERQHCQIVDPDSYATIWEGKCRAAVVGAIYSKQVELAVKEQRICRLPYNPALKVHTVWDLGWNDSMFISLVQRNRSEIAVIETIEDSHRTMDDYAAELQKKNLNWGYDWIPHDGFHKDYKTGKTAEDILKAFGRKVKPIPNIGLEDGIKIARNAFGQMVFDKDKSARLVECLKRYKRHIPKHGEPSAPVHDQYSHGADNYRYISLVADQLTNEDEHSIRTPYRAPIQTVPGFGSR